MATTTTTTTTTKPADKHCKRCGETARKHCTECQVCEPRESEHPYWCERASYYQR
jgi:hypothetical protein